MPLARVWQAYSSEEAPSGVTSEVVALQAELKAKGLETQLKQMELEKTELEKNGLEMQLKQRDLEAQLVAARATTPALSRSTTTVALQPALEVATLETNDVDEGGERPVDRASKLLEPYMQGQEVCSTHRASMLRPCFDSAHYAGPLDGRLRSLPNADLGSHGC